MRNQKIFLQLVVLVFSFACRFLMPVREGTGITDCADIVAAVGDIQPVDVPQHLFDSGTKQGDEFDPNQYFNVLTHISMQEGYALDYVYQNDSLGGFPLLYGRLADQVPYASITDIPGNTQLPDFREHLEIEDVEQGYFEYGVMDIMANQFYLFWHANYNDIRIICNPEAVNDIISSVNSGDFGNKFDLLQQTKARTMNNIQPVVSLIGEVAKIQVITFSKWGGFYRLTYTISRGFPYIVTDVKRGNLVPYDCGVMF